MPPEQFCCFRCDHLIQLNTRIPRKCIHEGMILIHINLVSCQLKCKNA